MKPAPKIWFFKDSFSPTPPEYVFCATSKEALAVEANRLLQEGWMLLSNPQHKMEWRLVGDELSIFEWYEFRARRGG